MEPGHRACAGRMEAGRAVSIEAAFLGVLTRDAEVRVSKTDKKFLQFNVRVGTDGERAQWVNVVSFDAAARELAGKMTKDTRVYTEGRLSLSEWTGKDGTARQGLSVIASHIRVAEIGEAKPKRSKPQRSKAGISVAKGDFFNDPIPF